MKKQSAILLLLLSTGLLQAQDSTFIASQIYYGIYEDSGNVVKLEFTEENQFTFSEDDINDNSSTLSRYGEGNYKIIEDSIHLYFDHIPRKKSEAKLQLIENDDKLVNINVKVFDENKHFMKGVTLWWQDRAMSTINSPKDFLGETDLVFSKIGENNWLRIEKTGFFISDVKIPKKTKKDLLVEVMLKPKPTQDARDYISSKKLTFLIVSDHEIQFLNNLLLKRDDYFQFDLQYILVEKFNQRRISVGDYIYSTQFPIKEITKGYMDRTFPTLRCYKTSMTTLFCMTPDKIDLLVLADKKEKGLIDIAIQPLIWYSGFEKKFIQKLMGDQPLPISNREEAVSGLINLYNHLNSEKKIILVGVDSKKQNYKLEVHHRSMFYNEESLYRELKIQFDVEGYFKEFTSFNPKVGESSSILGLKYETETQ